MSNISFFTKPTDTMEFINTTTTNVTFPPTKENITTVKLSSAGSGSTKVLPEQITITVSLNNNLVQVSHDLTNVLKNYSADAIKSSLVKIYGNKKVTDYSSKTIESIYISVDNFPATFEI